MRENSRALLTLLRREVVRFCRIWSQTLLPPVITVILYFIIFGNLIGSRIGNIGSYSYIEYIVPGLVMMSVITNSYANVVASFFGSKFQRSLEEMLVSPMSLTAIIWGYILGGVARGLVVGVLVTCFSFLFTPLHIQHVEVTLLIGVLACVLFSIAGLLNGIFARKFDDINIIPTFILNPLTYFGGVFYSINLLPEFWQQVTYLNPIFYMVNAFRYGMLGSADVQISTAVIVILGLIGGLYSWTLYLLKRGVGIRT